jgi:hypothetical protein
MALKWHHINIYNKVVLIVVQHGFCFIWLWSHLGNKKRLDEIFEKDIYRNMLMIEFVWQKLWINEMSNHGLNNVVTKCKNHTYDII